MDVVGGAFDCARLGANRNAVFSPGPRGGFGPESGGDARRAGGHHSAVAEQSALHPMGIAGDVVASVGAWVPAVAQRAAVRSLQAHDCGWVLGPARLSQLGPAQPAVEL